MNSTIVDKVSSIAAFLNKNKKKVTNDPEESTAGTADEQINHTDFWMHNKTTNVHQIKDLFANTVYILEKLNVIETIFIGIKFEWNKYVFVDLKGNFYSQND